MSTLLVAQAAGTLPVNQLWYAVPLIVAISLVYGATRHELMMPILVNAFRAATWILGFMGIIFVVLALISWLN